MKARLPIVSRGPARFTLRPAWMLALSLISVSGFSQDNGGISPEVRDQIAQILAIKKTFTPAEQKLSSNLAFASRMARGLPVGPAASLIDPKLLAGEVGVQIKTRGAATNLSNTLAGKGRTTSIVPGINHASVPLADLSTLAEDPSVVSISEPEPYQTNAGSVTSQGYVSHKVKGVVEDLHVDGTGVKVGVLADSAAPASVAALMTSGDLGANTTVLSAGVAATNEGAAMMEVVQDIAPGAQIYFATGAGGQAAMAANIAALAAAGCTIIVDDFTYIAEGAFQDGVITQAINTFVSNGGLYFSSAGNNGNLTSNTSAAWEGDFLSAGNITGPIATAGETGLVQNFGTAGSPQTYISVTAPTSGSQLLSLKWSDPLAASTNDYDIFLLDSTGSTLKGFGAAVQNGTQDPFERIQNTNILAGDRVVVVLFSGATRAIRVDGHKNRFSIATAGATYGHSAAAATTTIGATSWNSARTGTQPFDGTNNPVETFSSDGPRRIFYNPNGTAITPGNLLFGTNGGQLLQKPDLTAADNVVTATTGFIPFSGTSAAAAHAAGVAALVKSAKPTLTSNQIRAILFTTALDNMAPGVDRDGGVGVIDARAAVLAAQQ